MPYVTFFSRLKPFGHAILKGVGHGFWSDAHAVGSGWVSTLPRGLEREQKGLWPAAWHGLAGHTCKLQEEESPHHAGCRRHVQRVTAFPYFSFFVHLHHYTSPVCQLCDGKGRKRTTTVPMTTMVLARVIRKLRKDVAQRLLGSPRFTPCPNWGI